MQSTIRQIAELADVSVATVSRVFSGKDYVKAETRERILKVAEECGYRPKKYRKATARSVYRNTVMVMLPEIDNSFYCDILTGIENVLAQYDIDILICSSNNSPDQERHLLQLVEQMQFSGLIVVPISGSGSEANIGMFRDLRRKVPVVLLDRLLQGEDIDCVIMDNYNSARQGVQLLIRNRHRRIAFIAGPSTSSSAEARLNGFLDAMNANDLPIEPGYILRGEFNAETTYQQTKELIRKEKLLHDGRISVTAIFSSSSKMLSGSLLALTEEDLFVPDDIALFTFGETFLVRQDISFIRYPSQNMGEECARILLERMRSIRRAKNLPSKTISFDTTIELFGSEIFPVHALET